MHVMGNCPKSNYPPLLEAAQKKHVTNSTSMWWGTGTKGALTPVRSSLINCLSLYLYKSHVGEEESQGKVFARFQLFAFFCFSFEFNLSGHF